MKKTILSLLATTLLLTSCATIFTGTYDYISFDSKPSGTKVFLDGIELCETPCGEDIKRSINSKEVEFVLDGYKTKVVRLDKEFNVISVLNMTTIFGWAVDVATGAVLKYGRKHYRVDMERDEAFIASLKEAKEIHIDSNTKEATIYVQR